MDAEAVVEEEQLDASIGLIVLGVLGIGVEREAAFAERKVFAAAVRDDLDALGQRGAVVVHVVADELRPGLFAEDAIDLEHFDVLGARRGGQAIVILLIEADGAARVELALPFHLGTLSLKRLDHQQIFAGPPAALFGE